MRTLKSDENQQGKQQIKQNVRMMPCSVHMRVQKLGTARCGVMQREKTQGLGALCGSKHTPPPPWTASPRRSVY